MPNFQKKGHTTTNIDTARWVSLGRGRYWLLWHWLYVGMVVSTVSQWGHLSCVGSSPHVQPRTGSAHHSSCSPPSFS